MFLINRLKLSNELFILISLPSLFQSTALIYWLDFLTISVLGWLSDI